MYLKPVAFGMDLLHIYSKDASKIMHAVRANVYGHDSPNLCSAKISPMPCVNYMPIQYHWENVKCFRWEEAHRFFMCITCSTKLNAELYYYVISSLM